MMPRKYCEWPGFENVYFEDSFVLRIDEAAERVAFDLLLVLLPGSPYYAPPLPGEALCFRSATLEFSPVTRQTWLARGKNVFTDALGDVDLGNIDVLVERAPGEYYAEGDWGAIEIQPGAPVLRFQDV